MSNMQLSAENAKKVREMMLSKKWFGFDLDDTLHEFRKVSSAATLTTLLVIATEYEIPVEKLQDHYAGILKTKTATAFTDGKSSDDYRKERFAAVMKEFGIKPSKAFLTKLATTYKSSLETSLELKPGALQLIRYLKSLRKKIMVITEGPQDAQEWTIEKLGLRTKIDFLASTNAFGVSKVDGLFGKVLKKLGVEAADVVYVGDSVERDIGPAREVGMLVVHYDDKCSAAVTMEEMKINTLGMFGA